jgi:spore maturation protein CgeB
MRVFILDTNYPGFMADFRAKTPHLSNLSYDQTWHAVMAESFGTADFYSHNLAPLGIEAREYIGNDFELQSLWAKEKGIKVPADKTKLRLTRRKKIIPWIRYEISQNWIETILRAQIEDFQPDIFYTQDVNWLTPQFLRQIKPTVRLIAGQIGSALHRSDLSSYDVVFTLFPHYIEKLESLGVRSRYFRLGFEPRVLSRVTSEAADYEGAFVGGLSHAHTRRTQFLEDVFSQIPFDLWGYGVNELPSSSPLRLRHHGEVWGMAMFQVLQKSRVALNIHSDEAGAFACNMRLYEATGIGTALLTDQKKNLHEFFDVGQEVIAYENAEDCAHKLRYLLENDEAREQIALAGQARTLKQHTYAHRMEELAQMLEEELKLT